ncbi:MAG: hypothetical protein JWQ38_1733, partial [Flavipsychrobacter sp.]|nr:hypothetical protein [Flavipsychrobacter sp.]
PDDKQAMIFERFTQASAETSRQHGGTGLGLSIVKSLVGLYDGIISVQSEVGKGSVFSFTITFPKQKTVPTQVQQLAQRDNDKEQTRKIRILYAEDNVLNQTLVKHFSKNYGFELETADNGKIAIEKLKLKEYDLVLMDIQMPVLDGYEATTVIRKELKKDIPVIALTAHAMSGEKEKCLGLGMNDFVTKPFDPKDLNDKIIALVKV